MYQGGTVCARVRVHVHVHVRVRRARMCVRSFKICRLAFRCVCVCNGAVLTRRWHGRGPAVLTAGRPRVQFCVLCHPSVRARWPQVSRGRAARPARRGLREITTRRWSTPQAPSTSSAAAAAPSTGTCGRAPTEVRTGLVLGWSGLQGGVPRGTTRVLRGYYTGYQGVRRGV